MGRRVTGSLLIEIAANSSKMVAATNKANRKLSALNKQANLLKSSLVSMFAGAALLRGARATVGILANFEKQMSKVKAISGATELEFDKLTRNAKDLGRVSKFTATEIGKMQEELARLGLTVPQINAAADAVRKLATVADSEMGEAAKIMASTLKQFNIDASESAEVANIMAESFSKSALDLEKFAAAMANVGPTAKAAGIDLAKTTAILGTLVDAGIDASKAGTDLRKILVEVAKNGSTLEEEIFSLKAAEDKLTTSFDKFGQRAITSGIVLSENIAKQNELEAQLRDTNKELSTMVAIMEDNLISDVDKLKSAWEGFILAIGDTEFLRETTRGLSNMLNAITDFLEPGAIPETIRKIDFLKLELGDLDRQLDRSILFRKGFATDSEINTKIKIATQALDVLRRKLKALQDEVDTGPLKDDPDPPPLVTGIIHEEAKEGPLDNIIPEGFEEELAAILAKLLEVDQAMIDFGNEGAEALIKMADETANMSEEMELAAIIAKRLNDDIKSFFKDTIGDLAIGVLNDFAFALGRGNTAWQDFADTILSTSRAIIAELLAIAVAQEVKNKGFIAGLAVASVGLGITAGLIAKTRSRNAAAANSTSVPSSGARTSGTTVNINGFVGNNATQVASAVDNAIKTQENNTGRTTYLGG